MEAKQGANQNIHDAPDMKVLTRTEAASQAGLSERQKVTALRVAMVPAVRIQARAIRRCGELLRQVEPDKGGYHGNYAHDATDTRITRTQVATAAGLSERQKVTALRVAMVPAVRIQARAIRRCGELLRQVEPDKGGRPTKTHDGTDIGFSRTEAASQAGLSERHVSKCCPCAPSKAVKFKIILIIRNN